MQLRRVSWVVAIAAGCGSSPAPPGDPDATGGRGPDGARVDAAPPPAFDDATIVIGTEQTVFDWTTDRCDDLDLPDVYAHAVRTAQGLMLVSGNAPDNYAMFGADFASLARSCTPIMHSDESTAPETYSHWEWITSVYADGDTIHALVHDEYHDPFATNCKPGDTSPANPCWWNAVTYAASADAGRSFRAPPQPTHLVAPMPSRWDPDAAGPGRTPPPQGMMEPSNIVSGGDGYYYAIIRSMPSQTDPSDQGICAIRTATLADPGAWRYWTGSDWTGQFVDPYSVAPGTPIPRCAYVGHDTIGALHGSLTYSTYFQRWLLVGADMFAPDGTVVCGFWAAASPDLITWSAPKLIRAATFAWQPCPSDPVIAQEAYPSLIDPTDTTASFERTGQGADLYFMRSWGGLDRDLIRVPITFH